MRRTLQRSARRRCTLAPVMTSDGDGRPAWPQRPIVGRRAMRHEHSHRMLKASSSIPLPCSCPRILARTTVCEFLNVQNPRFDGVSPFWEHVTQKPILVEIKLGAIMTMVFPRTYKRGSMPVIASMLCRPTSEKSKVTVPKRHSLLAQGFTFPRAASSRIASSSAGVGGSVCEPCRTKICPSRIRFLSPIDFATPWGSFFGSRSTSI